jgi:hypothetical protein
VGVDLVPEVVAAVTPSRDEGAVNRVEDDVVHGVDVRPVPMALECEIFALQAHSIIGRLGEGGPFQQLPQERKAKSKNN